MASEKEVQLQKQLLELGSKLVLGLGIDKHGAKDQKVAATTKIRTWEFGSTKTGILLISKRLHGRAATTLTEMEQAPPKAVLDSMQTLLDAIVKPELLKHQDEEAKLLVATCTCEITRITAPEAPYDYDVLKGIFRLFVSTFNGLRDTKDPSFERRVHILHTVAKFRFAVPVVMLDLECDELVNEMFKTFFAVASDEHPEIVLVGMKRILTVLLEESEEIGEDLLLIILSILGRNKKDITPAARRLAMSVIKECAGQLEPGIEQFIISPMSRENSSSEIDYREFLYDIYRCTPPTLSKVLQRVTKELEEGREEDAATVAPKRKRGRPPKLQPKSPKTPVTAEISVVEGARVTEVSSPTSPGIKLVEKSQEPVKEPNENPEQDASAQRWKKKYSSAKGRRGKRRTISVNESLAQDIQDTSKEKTDGSLETKDPEASAVQSVDLDDQPLSTWIEGVHSPVPFNGPDVQDASKEKTDGSLETKDPEASAVQSVDLDDQPRSTWIEGVHSPVPFNGPVGTSTSERQLEIVACDIDADIPFVKTTPLWHTIESMQAFRKLPQNPHFRPLLKGVKESAREGLAIGTMVTFSTVVDRTYCLRFDDPRSAIEDSLETLVDLESNGFDVEVVRERLTRLLLMKDKQEELEDRSKVFVEKIEEQKIQEKSFDVELDELDRQIRQLEEKRSEVLLKKEKWNLEVGVLKAGEEAIEQEILEVAAEFDGLAAAPF